MSEDSVNTKSNQGTLVKPESLEEIVPKKRGPGRPPKPKAEERKEYRVSVDDTPEKVLSLDQEGFFLLFEDDPDRFLELPLETVQDLSKQSRESYSLAFLYSRKLAEERLNPPSGIEVIPGFASARRQLALEGTRPGMHYAWQRPDQVEMRKRQGYKVTSDPNVRTFNSHVGTTKTLGDMRGGEPEQILMEVPQQTFDARQQALAEKAVGRSRDVDAATEAALARMGGRVPDSFGARANTPKKKEVIRKRVG